MYHPGDGQCARQEAALAETVLLCRKKIEGNKRTEQTPDPRRSHVCTGAVTAIDFTYKCVSWRHLKTVCRR